MKEFLVVYTLPAVILLVLMFFFFLCGVIEDRTSGFAWEGLIESGITLAAVIYFYLCC